MSIENQRNCSAIASKTQNASLEAIYLKDHSRGSKTLAAWSLMKLIVENTINNSINSSFFNKYVISLCKLAIIYYNCNLKSKSLFLLIVFTP